MHLYSRVGDLVYANSRYVSVCANTGGGRKTLHLPGPSDVEDPLDGRPLGRDVTEVAFDAEPGETRIFRLGS